MGGYTFNVKRHVDRLLAALPRNFMRPHKPCAQCPFRTNSIRGWFGPSNAQAYFDAAMSEQLVHCHMAVATPGHERHCTGIALFRAKVCKEPRLALQAMHQSTCVERYGLAGILDHAGFKRHHYMEATNAKETKATGKAAKEEGG